MPRLGGNGLFFPHYSGSRGPRAQTSGGVQAPWGATRPHEEGPNPGAPRDLQRRPVPLTFVNGQTRGDPAVSLPLGRRSETSCRDRLGCRFAFPAIETCRLPVPIMHVWCSEWCACNELVPNGNAKIEKLQEIGFCSLIG